MGAQTWSTHTRQKLGSAYRRLTATPSPVGRSGDGSAEVDPVPAALSALPLSATSYLPESWIK